MSLKPFVPVLLLTASLVGVPPAQAQTSSAAAAPAASGAATGFEARKTRLLAHIQQRLQVLQQLQSCVTAASTPAALRQCDEAARPAKGRRGGRG